MPRPYVQEARTTSVPEAEQIGVVEAAVDVHGLWVVVLGAEGMHIEARGGGARGGAGLV